MTETRDDTPLDPVDQLLQQAAQAGTDAEAIAWGERALALAQPGSLAPAHYNVGLTLKYRGAWAASLHHNRIASDLAPDDQAAHWNMGIAATALRDWPAAREAWRRAGLEIAASEGPIAMDLGMTPVRLNPEGDAEVVWGTRIDPARVVLGNIPFPDSGFRAGDIVLNDGAPVGQREYLGRTYSVFNVLELFEASANSTFEAEVHAHDAADLEALTAALEAAAVDHEVWTTSVRNLCKQCSEGLPHDHVDADDQPTTWPERHMLGISTTSPDKAREVLTRWSARGNGFLSRLTGKANAERLLRFECALAGSSVH